MENNAYVTYKGNYSDYVKQKEEKILLQFENYKEQKKRINSMENAIKDLRQWTLQADNNKFFRRAVSIQRKLDKMEEIDNRIIFNNTDLYITLGERVALIGPNGSGKTTLLKMLLGETEFDSGNVQLGASLKIAYLLQTVTFNNLKDTCFSAKSPIKR